MLENQQQQCLRVCTNTMRHFHFLDQSFAETSTEF